jgi:hypothetical protein
MIIVRSKIHGRSPPVAIIEGLKLKSPHKGIFYVA